MHYIEFIVGDNTSYRRFSTLEEAREYYNDPIANWKEGNTFTLYGVISEWDWEELDSKYIPAPPQETN